MSRSLAILAGFTVFLLVGAALGWGIVAASIGSVNPSSWDSSVQTICGLAMLAGMLCFGVLASLVIPQLLRLDQP